MIEAACYNDFLSDLYFAPFFGGEGVIWHSLAQSIGASRVQPVYNSVVTVYDTFYAFWITLDRFARLQRLAVVFYWVKNKTDVHLPSQRRSIEKEKKKKTISRTHYSNLGYKCLSVPLTAHRWFLLNLTADVVWRHHGGFDGGIFTARKGQVETLER